MKNKIKFAVSAFLLSVICGCGQIDPGEVGFKTSFGEITSRDVLHEGLWFYSPFGGNLVVYDTKNQKLVFKTEQYTKDIQQCKIALSVIYNLKSSSVIEMHQRTGKEYPSTLIEPAVLGSVKDVMGKWEATDIISKREDATKFIKETLSAKMNQYGINIVDVEILDIEFTDVFERAVEAKQVAQENAKTAKNKTVQVEEESKQKVISAEAEAKAMAVRAKALESNKSLVEYEAVMKWDGKLPVYMMGNTVPFMKIENFNKDK